MLKNRKKFSSSKNHLKALCFLRIQELLGSQDNIGLNVTFYKEKMNNQE